MNYKKPKFKVSSGKEEDLLDEVEAFYKWKKEIAPELRQMLLDGCSSKEIAKKYVSFCTARLVTIALSSKDETKALAASKEILDRAEGKATEMKKIEHQFQEMEDSQLDALLKSELEAGNIQIISADSIAVSGTDDEDDDKGTLN